MSYNLIEQNKDDFRCQETVGLVEFLRRVQREEPLPKSLRVQGLETVLEEAVERYPDGGLGPKAAQDLLAPDDLADRLQEMETAVRSIEPVTSLEQDAWDTLTRLEENLKTLRAAEREHARAELAFQRAESMLEQFEHARDKVLKQLYDEIGVPSRGEDTQRAIDALTTIRANCDALIEMNPDGVVEKALRVAISVEEREYRDIYPRFRDQAKAEGRDREAEVYQRVVDSESQHADWFRAALAEFESTQTAAVH